MAGASAQRRDSLLLLYDRYLHDHPCPPASLEEFQIYASCHGSLLYKRPNKENPPFSVVSGETSGDHVGNVILEVENNSPCVE